MNDTREILIAITSALKACQVTFMDEHSVEILRFGKEYRVTCNADCFQVHLITCEKSYVRDEGCAFLEKKINTKNGVLKEEASK